MTKPLTPYQQLLQANNPNKPKQSKDDIRAKRFLPAAVVAALPDMSPTQRMNAIETARRLEKNPYAPRFDLAFGRRRS